MEQIVLDFINIHKVKEIQGTKVVADPMKPFSTRIPIPWTERKVWINIGTLTSKNFLRLKIFYNFLKKTTKSNHSFKFGFYDQILEKAIGEKLLEIIKNNDFERYLNLINFNSEKIDYYNFINLIQLFLIQVNDKLEQEIKKLNLKTLLGTKRVFIGIQFDKKYKKIGEIISNVIILSELNPRKVDEIQHNKIINNVIYEEMNQSDFGIFELSSGNKNVYYEMGYMDGQNKQTILLVNKNMYDDVSFKIPFDINSKIRIEYEDEDDLQIKLLKKIKWLKSEIY